MKISSKSWHYKLYVFFMQLINALKDKDDFYYIMPTKVGLCEYMRVILIWGPLTMLLYLFPITGVFTVFFFMPYVANGAAGIGWLFGSLATFVISVILIVVMWKFIASLRSAVKIDKRHNSNIKPSFGSLAKEFSAAKKSKLCPILEVSDE